MAITKSIIGSFIAIFLWFSTAWTGTEESFDAAKALAQESAKTDVGKKYDEAFGFYFGSRHADVMSICTSGLPESELKAFDIVAKISTDGLVETILVEPATKVAVCLRDKMLRAGYPQPPMPHYWVIINMRIE